MIQNKSVQDTIIMKKDYSQHIMNVTFRDLKIPESLHKWYLDHGWFSDYWKELPLNWQEWSNKELSKYPITNEIIEWRKSQL